MEPIEKEMDKEEDWEEEEERHKEKKIEIFPPFSLPSSKAFPIVRYS